MYAIVKDGGHQYKCEVGRKMYLELRDVEDGAKIELTDVLLLVKGEEGKEETIIGQPTVEGAKVVCEVMTKRKGPKVVIRWFRRRKNSRKKNGHRQTYIMVEVKEIIG
ncbi:MAG: 50S ribosomal protein L21 [Thermoguttaceae bacterium]|nr:50S ribosomal protein L21 [Thermoguttaceae bacterium]MBQ1862978.1 50S ribosomal protein L21 [Thermoguttaceae bacterium]MBQ2039008.1 50S ribosomal protein L21 [Thermoguttaceae bacterium]MBQ2555696.1 50S ribosomal protein L21 [Thermoguttaceae bacterium]MBQ3821442.1 50S ribosomal protein L21 [Thermoguttaceae bacterium]